MMQSVNCNTELQMEKLKAEMFGKMDKMEEAIMTGVTEKIDEAVSDLKEVMAENFEATKKKLEQLSSRLDDLEKQGKEILARIDETKKAVGALKKQSEAQHRELMQAEVADARASLVSDGVEHVVGGVLA